jgi:elongation factor G
VELDLREDGEPYAFVFKTTADQYGRYSYFRVVSGKVTPDMTLVNSRTGEPMKLGHLYTMRGKKATEVKEVMLRRHRGSGKDGENPHRRLPLLSEKSGQPDGYPVPGALLLHGHRAQVKGQDDKLAGGLSKLERRGLHLYL